VLESLLRSPAITLKETVMFIYINNAALRLVNYWPKHAPLSIEINLTGLPVNSMFNQVLHAVDMQLVGS
jgi:hypothetical protein